MVIFAWKKWSQNASKMKYFDPDRNDRSKHEIWVATIPNQMNSKEMATRQARPHIPNYHPISPCTNLLNISAPG